MQGSFEALLFLAIVFVPTPFENQVLPPSILGLNGGPTIPYIFPDSSKVTSFQSGGIRNFGGGFFASVDCGNFSSLLVWFHHVFRPKIEIAPPSRCRFDQVVELFKILIDNPR
jgi:hypothetical protein